MKKFRYLGLAVAALAACALMPAAGTAQQFSVVYAFGPLPDGQAPRGDLAQGQDGNLYGLTIDGGNSGEGTVFSVVLPGKEVGLASFADSTGGVHCNTGLTVGTDGSFFGTCPGGQSPYNFGTIFNADSTGKLSTLYAFSGSDGQNPEVGRPILGADGNYYGVTELGGAYNGGTAFVMTPDGHLSTLYNFGGVTGDPVSPSGSFIQGSDGNFYNTSLSGGKLGGGTVFRMTATGQVAVLHDFPSKSTTDGTTPMGGVVQAHRGTLYGVTFSGGSENLGTVYAVKSSGKEIILHSFSSSTDLASSPCDPLTIAIDGNLYGVAASSVNGTYGNSIAFEVTPTGAFTVLHQFDPAGDGTKASSPLLLDTNGVFYGVAEAGGTGGEGTLYSLNMGLHPFVNLSPAMGPVGATIGIYGQGFSAKTKVLFAGTPASFTPKGANYGLAVVPAGASSGYVRVRTPGLAMRSLQIFTVTSGARHQGSATRHATSRHASAKRGS